MVRLPGGGDVPSFCMDLTEVTVAAYAACARSHACSAAPTTASWGGISDADRAKWSLSCNGARADRQDHPVNCVAWAQAETYCRSMGKRLPTAAEWEWAAAAGEQRRTYPWGFRPPSDQLCWSGDAQRGGTCAVGGFEKGDALGGIHDLAGNVWEWTSTVSSGSDHVMKGGGWNRRDERDLMATGHLAGEPAFRGPNTGFRCAK